MDIDTGMEFFDSAETKDWSDGLADDVIAAIRAAHPIYDLGSTTTARLANDIKEQFRELHADLIRKLPGCRTRSLAATALEEASMWAVKSVYHDSNDS